MNEPFFFDESADSDDNNSDDPGINSDESSEEDASEDASGPGSVEADLDAVDTIEIDTVDTADVNAVDIAKLVQTVERSFQASVFQVEPVTHITYQLLFVDSERNVERIERHVMQLREANVIDRFDIARIIKRARGTRYRLTALLVYNVDLTLKEVLRGHPSPSQSRFTTTLLSLSNFTLRPTLACFHCVNSLHVVLSRIPSPNPKPTATTTATTTAAKRYISIHPSALTRSRKRQ